MSSQNVGVEDVNRAISTSHLSACKSSAGLSRKFSMSTYDGDPEEIHQFIPDGVEIKRVPYGFGLISTKFFPKGSVVYVGEQLVIKNRYAEFKLIIDNLEDTEYLLDTETHSVEISDTERWLYLFDSFMNHSCDPTTVSEIVGPNRYNTVALRDIVPGDEITCDYNLFEYDCHGKVIERCGCGSRKCIGRIAGFKYLSVSDQKDRIHLVEPEVLTAMSIDLSNRFYYITDLKCPEDRLEITRSGAGRDAFKMIATKDFQKGEVVCCNESLIFDQDSSIVIEILGDRLWLDNLVHTVNRGLGKREFFYFDSFQNHSCDPNTAMDYERNNEYRLVAINDINKGDELTSDYETFDIGLDGTCFVCTCGSTICRGVINA